MTFKSVTGIQQGKDWWSGVGNVGLGRFAGGQYYEPPSEQTAEFARVWDSLQTINNDIRQETVRAANEAEATGTTVKNGVGIVAAVAAAIALVAAWKWYKKRKRT
jgi:hypothetical protein